MSKSLIFPPSSRFVPGRWPAMVSLAQVYFAMAEERQNPRNQFRIKK